MILLLAHSANLAEAQDTSRSAGAKDVRVYSFIVTRDSGLYPRRIYKGLCATGTGGQGRVAIYWRFPMTTFEPTDDLGCSDMIWRSDKVFYRVYQDAESECSRLPEAGWLQAFRLPGDGEVEALLASIVFLTSRALTPEGGPGARHLEMSSFFRGIEEQAQGAYRAAPPDTQATGAPAMTLDLMRLLNEPPTGRVFERNEGPEGSVIWTMRRGADDSLLVQVEVGPPVAVSEGQLDRIFDPDTLGHWSLIAEAYRTYWSYYSQWQQLAADPDNASDARALYASGLDILKSPLPTEVRLALSQLHVYTAIWSGDIRAILQATADYLSECGQYEGTAADVILKLGKIVRDVEKHNVNLKSLDFIDPLLAGLCEHAPLQNPYFAQDIITGLRDQRSFYVGQRVIQAVEEVGSMESTALARLSEEMDLWRAATHVQVPGPNEITASMRELLARLNGSPPPGSLSSNDLRNVLGDAIASRFSDPPAKQRFVEDTLALLSSIVGEGPFPGEIDALTEAVVRLDKTYARMEISDAQFQATLTALLILSFYDASTPADQDLLAVQLQNIFDQASKETMELLKAGGFQDYLDEGSSEEFERASEQVASYIHDPLWPMFKYPLSSNELTRITSHIRLHVREQIEGIRESMSHTTSSRAGNPHRADRRIVGLGEVVAMEIPTHVIQMRLPVIGGTYFGRVRGQFRLFVPESVYASQAQTRSAIRGMAHSCFLGNRVSAPE